MRALLLDLDDTLMDDRTARRLAAANFFAAHAGTLQGVAAEALLARWQMATAKHWRRYECGEIDFVQQQRERVREFLQQPLDDAQADAAFMPYLCAYAANWRPVPGALAFLAATPGLPKLILTNGDAGQQRAKAQACGILAQVRGILTPQDCACRKPDPRMFEAALARLGVPAGECMMIGDDPMLDIAPAAGLGMQTFLIDAAHPEASLSAAQMLVEAGCLTHTTSRVRPFVGRCGL